MSGLETLPPLSREQIRDVDRRAMEEFSIPGIVLMENAGHGLARHVAAAAGFSQGDGRDHRPVAVVAGKGNNGGDGFVCARHLLNWGCPVAPIAYVGDLGAALERARAGTGGDWGTNLLILERMGHPLLAVSDPGSDAGFADLLGGAGDLSQQVQTVERQPHSAAVFSQCLLNGLANPPDRVGDELKTASRIEANDSGHEAEVSGADELGEG